jgi:hypothetical protein
MKLYCEDCNEEIKPGETRIHCSACGKLCCDGCSGGGRCLQHGIAFNPLTNPADAIELAEKLNLDVMRSSHTRKWAVSKGFNTPFMSENICEAICAAVDAALEAKP